MIWATAGVGLAVWVLCELAFGWSPAASILAGLFATFWMACLFGLVQIAEKNDREGWW